MSDEDIKQAFIDLMGPIVETKGFLEPMLSSYALEGIVRHLAKQPSGHVVAPPEIWEKAENILKLYEAITNE